MCSKYKDNRMYIPAYTFFNRLSLSKGRHARIWHGKILYKGVAKLLKKTQRTIPSLELSIVRLEPIITTMKVAKFYTNLEGSRVLPPQVENIAPPPPVRVSAILKIFYITESLILAVVIAAFTIGFIGTQEVA